MQNGRSVDEALAAWREAERRRTSTEGTPDHDEAVEDAERSRVEYLETVNGQNGGFKRKPERPD
jgi:hypothetical protein